MAKRPKQNRNRDPVFQIKKSSWQNTTVIASQEKLSIPCDLALLQKDPIANNAYNSIANLIFKDGYSIYNSKYSSHYKDLINEYNLIDFLKECLHELIFGTGNGIIIFDENKKLKLLPLFINNKLQYKAKIQSYSGKIVAFESTVLSGYTFSLDIDNVFYLKNGQALYGVSPLVLARDDIVGKNYDNKFLELVASTGYKDTIVGLIKDEIFDSDGLTTSGDTIENLAQNWTKAMAKLQEKGSGAAAINGIASFQNIQQRLPNSKELRIMRDTGIAQAFGLAPSFLGIGNSANHKTDKDADTTIDTTLTLYKQELYKVINWALSNYSSLYKQELKNNTVEFSFGDPVTENDLKIQDQQFKQMIEVTKNFPEFKSQIASKINLSKMFNKLDFLNDDI